MTERKRESDIPCTLVQDLLPLYIEQLTSKESDQLLQEHLADCEDCRNRESLLRSAVEARLAEQQQEEKAEINYLKKIRRSGRRKQFFVFLTVVVLMAALCGAGLKLYVFGFNVDYELDQFYVQHINDSTDAYTVHIQGHVTDKIFRRYKLITDSEGNDNLKICARLPLPWEDKAAVEAGSSFDLHINASEVNGNLTTPFYYIGPNETVLSVYDRQLFEAKNPYVGDMSANQKLAQLILDADHLGGVENELQTDEKPYIWTLHFTQPLETGEEADYLQRVMPGKACLLLALIDNLDEIRWTYVEETENGTEERKGSMNLEEATLFNGVYIKDCADSPYEIHKLRNRITDATYSIENPDQ